MNYITYKDANGKLTCSFKAMQYDIVILNTGLFKDELALVTHINEETKHVHIRVIKNGIDMIFNIKSVSFVNHNNRTAAKSYVELCNKMRDNLIKKYSNKQYIIDNWFKDKFIINDIVGKTIANGINLTLSSSAKYVIWLTNTKDTIDLILHYGNIDYISKIIKTKSNIVDTDIELIKKLYKYFYD